MQKTIKLPYSVIGQLPVEKPKPPEMGWDFAFAGHEIAKGYKATERENKAFTGEFNERFSTILDGFSPSRGTQNRSEIYSIDDAIRVSQMSYWNDSVVRNTIDTLAELASEGLSIKHSVPSIQRFYEAWAKQVRFNEIINQGMLEFFRSGNVAIYRFDGEITAEDRRQMLRSMGYRKQILAAAQTVTLPVGYTIFNPLSLRTMGSPVLGTIKYSFTVPYDSIKMVIAPQTEIEQQIVDRLDKGLVQQIRKAVEEQGGISALSIGNKNVTVELDPSHLTLLFRGKQPYENFAVPFLLAVADDVSYKKELRNLDRATSRAVIRFMLHVKIGDKDHPPKAKHFADARKILDSGSVSQYLVTPYNVEIEPIIPPIDKILGSNKFEAVDRDILKGLGISEILLGGPGGSFTNSFLSIKALIERLQDCHRKFLEDFINKEMERIANEMNFREPATASFKMMNLRDENAERRVLYQLAQAGVLSPRSVITVLQDGSWPSYEEEVERQSDWAEQRKKGHFLSATERTTLLAAKSAPTSPTKEPETPVNKGRPPGSTAPQQVNRVTNPKGINAALASILRLTTDLTPSAEHLLKAKGEPKSEQQDLKSAIRFALLTTLSHLTPDADHDDAENMLREVILKNRQPPADVIIKGDREQDLMDWLIETWSACDVDV